MSNILIVGCGKLGTPLGTQLVELGHQVTGIKRTLHADDDPSIHWLGMDISTTEDFDLLPAKPDLVFVILTPAARSPQGYAQTYQTGLSRLLEHFNAQGEKPWIGFVSATSVYGQQSGEWVDETSVTEPLTYNGQSLLQAERAVLAFNADSVIIRFSGIYGAARSRVMDKLQSAQSIQQTPPLYSNRIHQDDCIGVLYFLATERLAGRALDSIYLATDHDGATSFEVMTWLAKEAGLILPTAETAAADAPRNKRCSNRLLRQRGYVFRYQHYRDGYRATLLARRSNAG